MINQQIRQILLCHKDWQVIDYHAEQGHKQLGWARPGFKIYKSKFGEFVAPYKQVGNELASNFSDAAQAHSICGSPDVPVLFKGQLYKCAAVANVMDYTQQNWHNYRPLNSTDDLAEFVAHINRPESVCAQCPSKDQAIIYNHLDPKNVTVRQQSILKS